MGIVRLLGFGHAMHPTVSKLKKFLVFQDISDKQVDEIGKQMEVRFAEAGEVFVELGSDVMCQYFLLEGTVERTTSDGEINIVAATDKSARNALSSLVPHRYCLKAVGSVAYIKLDAKLIASITQAKWHPTRRSGVIVHHGGDEQIDVGAAVEQELIYSFLQDLENDSLTLPSFPDIALRIGRAMTDENNDAETIARIIQTDPVITTKLLKAANSPLYAGLSQIKSCSDAVMRIGFETTRRLVICFAFKELFSSTSPVLGKRMKMLWEHSTKVGAICFFLAKRDSRFNQEQAMLAGLLHDIGVVAILSYLIQYPEESKDPQLVEHVITQLRVETSGMLLRKWAFSDDLVVAATDAEDWWRDPSPEPDYCDLVLIAQLHSFVGSAEAMDYPAIDGIPAYGKFHLGELTPEKSLQILDEAKEYILATGTMFSDEEATGLDQVDDPDKLAL